MGGGNRQTPGDGLRNKQRPPALVPVVAKPVTRQSYHGIEEGRLKGRHACKKIRTSIRSICSCKIERMHVRCPSEKLAPSKRQ